MEDMIFEIKVSVQRKKGHSKEDVRRKLSRLIAGHSSWDTDGLCVKVDSVKIPKKKKKD